MGKSVHPAAVIGKGIVLSVEGQRLLHASGDETALPDGLRLEPGTLTLIMGPNGAGKTVWLEKLAGLRHPEGLAIRYGDQPLWLRKKITPGHRLNPEALLRYAYSGQSPEQALFMRTLREELQFSLRPYTGRANVKKPNLEETQDLERVLDTVGLPASYLERDPYRMSGGEKRRAALAALFVTPAPWLLLDEPTAGLDRNGHEKLAQLIQQMKKEGKGIVLVSHDSDWALPLADKVLLKHPDGGMRSCTAGELIAHPEWMRQTGMQAPQWMRVIRSAWQAGAGIPLERLWDPGEAAEALSGFFPHSAWPAQESSTVASVEIAKHVREEKTHPLNRFDPRAVWLGYVLLSAGLFSLSTWPGLLAGAAVVVSLLLIGKIPVRRWKGLIAGFVYFSILLAGVASIGSSWGKPGWISWDTETFVGTLFPLARTLTVLLIGLSLPLVMTPLSLRRSLEQLMPQRRKIPVSWQRIILTVTLTIRFVPVLLAEWERFGRIYLARGKATGRSPRSFYRRLRGVTLPLLLTLFRLGDEVAVALESRGVRRGVNPTRASRLEWKWRDTVLAAGAAGLAGILWLLR